MKECFIAPPDGGIMFVRLSVRHQTCGHNILKTKKTTLTPIAHVVHGARAWNVQLLGSEGQRSRSHEAEDRSGGVAESSFSTRFGSSSFYGWLMFNISQKKWQPHRRSLLNAYCIIFNIISLDFCRATLCRHAVSVCVSVCLSRSRILWKRINISSKFFPHRADKPF